MLLILNPHSTDITIISRDDPIRKFFWYAHGQKVRLREMLEVVLIYFINVECLKVDCAHLFLGFLCPSSRSLCCVGFL